MYGTRIHLLARCGGTTWLMRKCSGMGPGRVVQPAHLPETAPPWAVLYVAISNLATACRGPARQSGPSSRAWLLSTVGSARPQSYIPESPSTSAPRAHSAGAHNGRTPAQQHPKKPGIFACACGECLPFSLIPLFPLFFKARHGERASGLPKNDADETGPSQPAVRLQVAPLDSSSNSATSFSMSLVTLRASSTTVAGTASDVVTSLLRFDASPGPGPACFFEPFTCTVAPAPLLVLLPPAPDSAGPLPFADDDEDVLGAGPAAVSLRTSSRICFRRTGNVVTSPLRRRARARFCTCVGQLFECALRV